MKLKYMPSRVLFFRRGQPDRVDKQEQSGAVKRGASTKEIHERKAANKTTKEREETEKKREGVGEEREEKRKNKKKEMCRVV